MNYLEIKKTAKELIEFIEKYNLDDYNDRIVKRFLKELIYVIDIENIVLDKEQEVKDIIASLFPPRGGLSEMYVSDENREKMNKINDKLENLKKRLINLKRNK